MAPDLDDTCWSRLQYPQQCLFRELGAQEDSSAVMLACSSVGDGLGFAANEEVRTVVSL